MMDSDSSEEDPRFRIPRGESDEEIDSDLASISSSEIPSNKKTGKFSEKEAEEDESDVSGGVLLSDLLDSKATREKISQNAEALSQGRKHTTLNDDLSPEISGSESEEEADEAALANITMAATGRRDLSREKLRAARKVIPGIGKESLHGIPGVADISQKEMMARMLDALKPEDNEEKPAIEGFSELQKKVRRLHSHGKKELAVPLPEPVQERMERSVAYDHVKKDVTEKWARVVQKNRKAQRLEFPLNAPGRYVPATTDVAAKAKAKNEYEEEIEKIMKEAGVSNEKEIVDGEDKELQDDLDAAKVSKEEVLERRRELAKMRSLSFHYEAKMKRIKKIKSKRFRRVMKKEREKLEKANMGDTSDLEEDAIKAERRRAEERMTLRHKNTSKWVRRQLSRGEDKRNVETRQAIEEQLRMHEELRQKQEGIDSEDSDEDSDMDDEEKKERLEQELQKIGEEIIAGTDDQDNVEKKKVKGIMGMRFMQAAQERKRQEALNLLKQMDQDENNEEEEYSDPEITGRRVFSGKPTVKGKQNNNETAQDGNLEDDDDIDDDEDTLELKKRLLKEQKESQPVARACLDTTNDVSARDGLYSAMTRKGNATRTVGRIAADKDVITEEAVLNNPWLNGSTNKTGNESKSKANEDSVSNQKAEQIQPSTNKKDEGKKKRNRRKSGKKRNLELEGNEDDTSKVEAPNAKRERGFNSLNEQSTDAARERMTAVSAAFADAGGGDLAEFAATKEAEIEMDVQVAVVNNGIEPILPGWGNWDGAGVKKKQKKESTFAKAARLRLEAAKSSAIAKRVDKDRPHVILNERRMKAASGLMLSSVPFPYSSASEWASEIGTPMVKELNPNKGFEKLVKPRVKKIAGSVIEPITHGRAEQKMRKKIDKKSNGSGHGRIDILQQRQVRAKVRTDSRKGLLQ